MRTRLILLLSSAALLAGQITVTLTPQSSPFPLPAGIQLYSASACAAPIESRPRAISATQIEAVAGSLGIAMQEPITYSGIFARAERGAASRALTGIGWFSLTVGVGATVVTAIKVNQPKIGNADTWATISTVGAAAGVGIPLIQSKVQSDFNARATITQGVQALLVQDMGAIYAVPAFSVTSPGCAHVEMLGVGAQKGNQGVLP